MTKKIDFDKYALFVDGVTSDSSKDYKSFLESLSYLDGEGSNIIELGDVLWYVMQACKALDVTIEEVVAGNVDKLKKRYPGGEFNVYQSENRKEGDR